MSLICVALVEELWSKPLLFESDPSKDFTSAMTWFKQASYSIFKHKTEGKQVKQFLLESGLIVMQEEFWSQCTLIWLFEPLLQPIKQKHIFQNLKTLISQYKSLAYINKKFNELKLGIMDVMTGLNGIDRYSTKLTDMKQLNFEDYLTELQSQMSKSKYSNPNTIPVMVSSQSLSCSSILQESPNLITHLEMIKTHS